MWHFIVGTWYAGFFIGACSEGSQFLALQTRLLGILMCVSLCDHELDLFRILSKDWNCCGINVWIFSFSRSGRVVFPSRSTSECFHQQHVGSPSPFFPDTTWYCQMFLIFLSLTGGSGLYWGACVCLNLHLSAWQEGWTSFHVFIFVYLCIFISHIDFSVNYWFIPFAPFSNFLIDHLILHLIYIL